MKSFTEDRDGSAGRDHGPADAAAHRSQYFRPLRGGGP